MDRLLRAAKSEIIVAKTGCHESPVWKYIWDKLRILRTLLHANKSFERLCDEMSVISRWSS